MSRSNTLETLSALMGRDPFKVLQECYKIDYLIVEMRTGGYIVEMRTGGYSVRRDGDFVRDKRGRRRSWDSYEKCKNAVSKGKA